MRPAVRALPKLLALIVDTRLLVCVLLGLAAALFAYQAPFSGRVAVGWLGDRLFLLADPSALTPDSSRLYADELTPDSPDGRSRWTRRQALVSFPGPGRVPLTVGLTVMGWPTVPADLPVRQPEVTVLANGLELGRFTPTSSWETFHFDLPARTLGEGSLELRLEMSHTFTDSYAPDGALVLDPRPKGVRLAAVELRSTVSGMTRLLLPHADTVWLLTLVAALLYLTLRGLLRPTPAFVGAALLVAGLALALALARIWTAALLPQVLPLALIALVLGYHRPLLAYYRALLARYRRGNTLGYGLLAAGLGWLVLVLLNWVRSRPIFDADIFWAEFPDSLLYIIFSIALLVLVLVQGRNELPQGLAWLQQKLIRGRLSLLLLLVLGGLWIGYQGLLLRDLPAIGHADYADNGVVARNLLRGRGWVVDYVTQYYRLYNDGSSVVRPQETWPLLQPLWIVPFFRAFGPSAWAARLPNLIFNGLLLLLIYNIGAQLWDRRVGLCAALVTLTNSLFFNTAIYATSDLAFVVFATAAVYCLYLALIPPSPRWLLLSASGLLSGLMLLQRPSSGLIAAGMGLWLLGNRLAVQTHPTARRLSASIRRILMPGLVWGGIAVVLLLPYLLRNQQVFGKPFYSTESHDAWVIEYSHDWDDIYKVYAQDPPLNGPGMPDRSWILRWGFDTTLRKIERQSVYLRNLLLPAWEGGPLMLATRPEQNSITLLHTMGGWLALVGLLLAFGRRFHLPGLLALAFGPYLLFLIFYWHIEERYLPLLIPWMALLGMGVLWGMHDRLARLHAGRWSGLALAGVIAALFAIMQPSWPDIAYKIRVEPLLWAPDLEAYQWLRRLPPNTVVMARGPWQLNFYAEQPAIMTPNTDDVDTLLYIANYYRARYLVVETIQNTGAAGQRALSQLTLDRTGGEQCRPTPEGVARPERRLPIAYCSRFYKLDDGSRYQTVVYRFPEKYSGAAGLGGPP